MKNLSFWGSGRPRAAQKPFKKVGGFAPYLFKAAQNHKMTDSPSVGGPVDGKRGP